MTENPVKQVPKKGELLINAANSLLKSGKLSSGEAMVMIKFRNTLENLQPYIEECTDIEDYKVKIEVLRGMTAHFMISCEETGLHFKDSNGITPLGKDLALLGRDTIDMICKLYQAEIEQIKKQKGKNDPLITQYKNDLNPLRRIVDKFTDEVRDGLLIEMQDNSRNIKKALDARREKENSDASSPVISPVNLMVSQSVDKYRLF